LYNARGKGVRQEKETCKRDRNDTSSCSESASQVFGSENDIGNFVGVPLTDADRRKVLFNCWSPPGFSFPYVTVGAQNRSFQKQWLNEFTWLAYSNIYTGAFCKWFVVFAPQTISRSAKPPGSLVSGRHCNYEKAKEHYNNHQTVTIINYVQPRSINLCRQMPTNPEMIFWLQRSKRWFCYLQQTFFCQCWRGSTKIKMGIIELHCSSVLKSKFQNVDIKTFYQYVGRTYPKIKELTSKTMSTFTNDILEFLDIPDFR